MKVTSTFAVYAAIGGNSLVMVAKFVAFFMTGSSAMLSEGIHSFADVSNQCLLALGIKRSHKNPDKRHPYGYTRERFIWALISAVGIFFLGCGVTVYHGFSVLSDPSHITDYPLAFSVLIFAALVEGWTLYVAYRSVKDEAVSLNMGLMQYVRQSTDPMGLAVLLEDGAAVIGVFIAGTGLFLSKITGNMMWDGIATIAIGVLLGFVAIFLIYKTKALLVGQAIPTSSRRRILKILRSDPVVEKIYDVKTAVLGSNNLRFKAEIEFNGEKIAERQIKIMNLEEVLASLKDTKSLELFLKEYGDHLVEVLGDEIDRMESNIKKAVPEVKHIDIETN